MPAIDELELAGALLTLDKAASTVDLQDLPELIGRLVSVEERVRLRLRHGLRGADADASSDENLSAVDAARRLGVSPDWLYRNVRRLPFALKIGRRVVFSSNGLERWNGQRKVR